MRAAAQQVLGLFCVLFYASSTHAYGPTGHWIVGEIATANLCAEAANEVEQLLDGAPLARAGQWPDWIRRNPQWRHTGPWHYINVPDGRTIDARTGSEGDNVIWAIEHFTGELADRSLPDGRRATALRFLAHFVADIHQPLHVGRKEDRGGNAIDVTVNGQSLNLHRLWDAQWLLKLDRRESGYDQDGQIEALMRLGQNQSGPAAEADVRAWATESMALRPGVYAFTPGESVELEPEYVERARQISRQRLALAGFRLAGTLNSLFCGPGQAPESR